MSKAKIKQRKDNKGRVLRKGESQRKSDGLYIYTYTDSFKRRRYIYSTDLSELREREKTILIDTLDGLDMYLAAKADINFVFDRYMSISPGLRPSTRGSYITTYDRYIRESFGKRIIGDVRYSDIKNFYNYLYSENNLSLNSIRGVNKLLSCAFKLAVRDNIIRANPVTGCITDFSHSHGLHNKVRHGLNPDEMKAFLRHTATSPEYAHWYPLFMVLMGTGLRVGEVIGLRWDDVDLKERLINVNHSITYSVHADGVHRFSAGPTKTEAGIRLVPMLDDVYDVLKLEYERQCETGISDYDIEGYTNFIFINKNGTIHHPHCINNAVNRVRIQFNEKEVLDAARSHRKPMYIDRFSCHNMRHTFCSRLCENVTDVKAVQEIMGHANIKTTLDIYAESNYPKKKEVISNLSKTISIF